MEVIGKEIKKIDGLSLVLGKKAYTDDYTRKNCLIVKVLRGVDSFENIESIDISEAIKVIGIECILINNRIGTDIIDYYKIDTFNPIHKNDIAIIAGENEEVVERAKSYINIKYKFKIGENKVKDTKVAFEYSDVKRAFNNSSVILEQVYCIGNNYNSFMETNRSFTYLDQYERLIVVSSTEMPFYLRNELSKNLSIPDSKIRVIASKTGGGYGGKQGLSSEYYASVVTLKTGKATKIIYSTSELLELNKKPQTIANIKIGANNDGTINVIELNVKGDINYLWEKDSGLFVNAISEAFSLYNLDAASYKGEYEKNENSDSSIKEDFSEIVFSIESAVNLLSEKLNLDPVLVREKNIIKKGDKLLVLKDLNEKYTEVSEEIVNLDVLKSIEKGKKIFGWDKKYIKNKAKDNKYKGVGMAIARQDIGLAKEDAASVAIKFHEDGTFMLTVGTNYLGIGSETILAQVCAQSIGVSYKKITVVSGDTDIVPFLSNTYSTKTLYALGASVKKAGEKMKQAILKQAAVFLNTHEDLVVFNNDEIKCTKKDKSITWREFGKGCIMAQNHIFTCEYHNFKKPSMTYMASFVEVEVDIDTGKVFVNKFLGVLGIGTCINPLITNVQIEGNVVRGIGKALLEEVLEYENNPLTYKIPTRCDFGGIEISFVDESLESDLYGARSFGEIGFNTVSPAIQNAIYNAVGVSINTLPITPEKIIMSINSR